MNLLFKKNIEETVFSVWFFNGFMRNEENFVLNFDLLPVFNIWFLGKAEDSSIDKALHISFSWLVFELEIDVEKYKEGRR